MKSKRLIAFFRFFYDFLEYASETFSISPLSNTDITSQQPFPKKPA